METKKSRDEAKKYVLKMAREHDVVTMGYHDVEWLDWTVAGAELSILS